MTTQDAVGGESAVVTKVAGLVILAPPHEPFVHLGVTVCALKVVVVSESGFACCM